MLGLFHESEYVFRKDFATATKLAADIAKDMLSQVATLVDPPGGHTKDYNEQIPSLFLSEGKEQPQKPLNPHGGQAWKLKGEADLDFITAHRETVAKSEKSWREKIPE